MDVKKLREICEKATPGPWEWQYSEKWGTIVFNDTLGVITAYTNERGNPDITIAEEDLEFIAAARTALPELLDEVEMLRKAFQQACDWIHQDSGCPADVFDWGCPHVGENECQENAVECWEQYFLEKVRGE